jgi:hypothetical protein
MPETLHDRPAVFSDHYAINNAAYQSSRLALSESYRQMVGRPAENYDPRIHNTVICRPTGAGPSRLAAADRIRLQPFF